MDLNKDTVDAYMEDTISDFLSMDGILDCIKDGKITLEEMVSSFERILVEKVPELGTSK